MEYGNIVQEAAWESKDDHRPPEGWPDKGRITFHNYDMRYREGLDLVLKTITCDNNYCDKDIRNDLLFLCHYERVQEMY